MTAESSCYSKKRYTTEDEANRVARLCKERRGAELRVYPCFQCGGYHLTSQVEKRRVANMDDYRGRADDEFPPPGGNDVPPDDAA